MSFPCTGLLSRYLQGNDWEPEFTSGLPHWWQRLEHLSRYLLSP